MGICPICKAAAEVGLETIGDFRQFCCPRCGNYEITRSALAMLPSRMATEEAKSRARLSHAIRQLANSVPANEWPEINSMNLDELVKKALPSIESQKINLLRWAAKQLGDDQLGAVDLPDDDQLLGIIGTIDSDRADALISIAAKDGLVKLVPDNCIAITAYGWQRLEPIASTEKIKATNAVNAMPADHPQSVRAHCNRCKGERKALVRATYTVSGNDGEVSWSNTYDILECCGCEEMNVRHEYWFSE